MIIKRPMLVLGHKGMLGQMAVKYFSDKVEAVHTTDTRFTPESKWDFMAFIRKYPNAIVLNCIGLIKQKSADDNSLLWTNTILPLELANHCLPTQTLVHPSTDCVFDGLAGQAYEKGDEATAKDAYGWSKRLSELALLSRLNTLIYRVSIIGPDSSEKPKGLLGWFLSQPKGSHLKGYTNHLWNGITTLEWCKQVEKFLIYNPIRYLVSREAQLIQLGVEERLSKYDLLNLFQEIYQTDHTIDAFETEQAIDRRLVPEVACKSIKEQLQEMKDI